MKRRAAMFAVAAALVSLVSPLRAQDATLAAARIVAELRLLYDRMTESIAELREQNATAHEVSTFLDRAATTYQRLQDMDLDSFLLRRQSARESTARAAAAAGLTALIGELGARAQRSESDTERASWRRDAADLARIAERRGMLEQLDAVNVRNMARSNEDLSARESARISAQALSAIADIELQRQRQAADREQAAVQARQIERSALGSQRRLNRVMSDTGW